MEIQWVHWLNVHIYIFSSARQCCKDVGEQEEKNRGLS